MQSSNFTPFERYQTAECSRSIERFPRAIQQRIVTRIGMLSDNPRPHGSIKLAGEKDAYRIRVGEYRILYTIEALLESEWAISGRLSDLVDEVSGAWESHPALSQNRT